MGGCLLKPRCYIEMENVGEKSCPFMNQNIVKVSIIEFQCRFVYYTYYVSEHRSFKFN